MQKIWILTALTATVLTAQEMSIEEQLANEQITAPTSLSTSMMPDLSLIADMGYMGDEFTLNYAELTLGASVDNYFDLLGVFHISTEEIEIEEAYATTTDLPYHIRAKIGRFKSDFGYLNKNMHIVIISLKHLLSIKHFWEKKDSRKKDFKYSMFSLQTFI